MNAARTRRPAAIAAAVTSILISGCGHDDGVRAGPGGSRLAKDRAEAADAIIANARAYVEAREKSPDRPASRGALAAQEAALEAIADAAVAKSVARRASALADDETIDLGRAARVKTAAGLLERAADITTAQAKESLRSGDTTTLAGDLAFVRAIARALRIDIAAMESESGHDVED